MNYFKLGWGINIFDVLEVLLFYKLEFEFVLKGVYLYLFFVSCEYMYFLKNLIYL